MPRFSLPTVLAIAFFVLVLPVVLFAQDLVVPAGADPTQYLIMSAIVLLTPIVINYIKKAIYTEKALPDGSVAYLPPNGWAPWIISLLPPLISALLAWLATLVTNQDQSIWVMFGLGVLAHYVREVAKPITGAIGNVASKQQLLNADPKRVG